MAYRKSSFLLAVGTSLAAVLFSLGLLQMSRVPVHARTGTGLVRWEPPAQLPPPDSGLDFMAHFAE